MEKTALVLSGGALFCSYQAGAWSVLADEIRPDLIVGVSAGGLNAWAIASGMPPQELVRDWRSEATARLLERRTGAIPALGVFRREPLEQKCRALTAKWKPFLPLAITATQVPQFRIRVFRDREITWKHLLASCAVPGGFPPVRIGLNLYVDGGILSSLPIRTAIELGATRIIAINALAGSAPPAGVRVAARGLQLLSGSRRPYPPHVEIIRIQPATPLGDFASAARWDPVKLNGWIAQGAADAGAALREHPALAPGRLQVA